MRRTTVRADDHSITVHIPLTYTAAAAAVDNAMVKALAWAFRWRKLLDSGVHATLEDLARAKGVNATHVSRMLRLGCSRLISWRRSWMGGRRSCSWMLYCRDSVEWERQPGSLGQSGRQVEVLTATAKEGPMPLN